MASGRAQGDHRDLELGARHEPGGDPVAHPGIYNAGVADEGDAGFERPP